MKGKISFLFAVLLMSLLSVIGCGNNATTNDNGAALTSIAVTPATSSIATGATQQFAATGTYSDNSTQVITGSVSWISTDTSKANISNAGMATAVAAGTTTIKAMSGSISGTASLTVSVPVATTTANQQLFLASGSSLNGTIVSSSNNEITVSVGSSITGTVNLTSVNNNAASSIVPVILTPTWGDRATSYQTIITSVGTGTVSLTKSISLTAPNTAGTYFIIFASGGEMDGGDLASSTNWAAGSNVWNDGNDLNDLPESQLSGSLTSGNVTIPNYQFGDGNRSYAIGCSYVKVTVTTATPSDANQKLFLASGSSLNGTIVNSSSNDITVSVGSSITGTINLTSVNNNASSSVVPVIITPTWGDRTTNYQTMITSVPTGTVSLTRSISLTAPSTAGTYFIVFASGGEMDGGDIASSTNWAAGSNVWNDGNDIVDLSESQLLGSLTSGYVTIPNYQFGDGNRSYAVGCSYVKVVVTNSTTLMGGAIQGTPLILANVVTTLTGSAGISGSTDGTGVAARFKYPEAITTDGTNLYVADYVNHTIRKIVIDTGTVTTLAGSPGVPGAVDGIGSAARFNQPRGITTDGVSLYVADEANLTIRKVIISTAEVTTLAGSTGIIGSTDGTGTAAKFHYPIGITTDGTNIYIADCQNHTIRKIVLSNGAVTTLAGAAGVIGSNDGIGIAARFYFPNGIATDGTNLFVTDSWNNTIRKIVISSGVVTTLAGSAGQSGSTDGTGTAARFYNPFHITTDGTYLYFADQSNHTIRKLTIASGLVTTLAGSAGFAGSSDGTGSAARFNYPAAVTTDGNKLYIADSHNHTIRVIQ